MNGIQLIELQMELLENLRELKQIFRSLTPPEKVEQIFWESLQESKPPSIYQQRLMKGQ